MLFVPYSSIMPMMFCRMPVRIEAMQIAVITPMTIPSTVRKLRNLCPRTLSSAIRRVSLKIPFGSRSFITGSVCVRQGHNRIESRCFERGINAGDHAHASRYDQREQNVSDRDRHRDRRERGDQCCDTPGGE